MAYALVFNGTGYVSIPSKTSGSTTADTWTAIFDLEIPNTTDQTLWGRTSTSTSDYFRITGSNTLSWRIGAGTVNNITLDPTFTFPVNERFTLGVYREAGRNLVIKINDVEAYRANGVAFGNAGNAMDVAAIGKASVGVFTGKMYSASIQGQEYLNSSNASATTWGDSADFSTSALATDGSQWEFYAAGPSAISFSGSIDNLSFLVGEVVNEDLTTGFNGSEVPFTFSNTGASLAGTGLTINSAGFLVGTVTSEVTIVGVQLTGTDTSLNTAVSNTFDIVLTEPVVDLGILSEECPSSGRDGASIGYNPDWFGRYVKAEIITQPVHGTVILNPDTSFVYSGDGSEDQMLVKITLDGTTVINVPVRFVP